MFNEKESKTFDSIYAEVSYYKLKFNKYKLNMKVMREASETSYKERLEAVQNCEIISNQLKNEKMLRKNFEEKLLDLIKSDYQNKEKISKLEMENKEYIDTIRDFKLGIKNEKIINEDVIRSMNKQDFMQTSTALKERSMNNISNKFDLEKLRKSLTIDFLDYERDSLSFKKKIIGKEEQIFKIEKILKQWIELTENFEKVSENFCNVMSVLSNSLISDLEMFDDCPDSISLIYCLNGMINDLISQFRIFIASIQNSFIIQLKEFVSNKFIDLKESRASTSKHAEEFNLYTVKFLAIKKSQIKENQRDSYNLVYRTHEFSKFDYISKVNSILLYMKIDLPEKISLLIYAFLVLYNY